MPAARKTPAEKKRLSYERDGRNTYGENDKASRKAIPRFKAKSHREARHIESQEVTVANVASEEMLDRTDQRLFERLRNLKNNMQRKAADTPLGQALAIEGKLDISASKSKRKANRRLAHENRLRLASVKGRA